MNDRKRIIRRLKFTHDNFVNRLATGKPDKILLVFKRLRKYLNDLLRKIPSSENSVRSLIKLTKAINRIAEFSKQNGIPPYDFIPEREQINRYATEYLKQKLNLKYEGKCQWHGEILLNLYLELIIKFTVVKADRKVNVRPNYLKNPLTGQNLELDILFN